MHPTWRKSTRSTDQANCVELAYNGAVAAVRDSKNIPGPTLALSPSALRALVAYSAALE
ncbi:DUF397 domain-containing protein [Actinokineospora auranticolor]|uniref:Uncharacterized protein DUF397 n=1 Tax=Actinokineospora auranticolor TaxID=155976 RepID=A0A2S6GYF5_9PSEU|nr:DUF397 domain-containing protein [Actinokineospora auranticolor]PPK70238.1 uncharacterized protein DUF397 [Actinokineospora auranticolor]